MIGLQLLVINRVEAMLQALKTERVIKQFYYTPRAITQAPEFPFAFFSMAADRDYLRDKQHGGAPAYSPLSRIQITIALKAESTYAVKELAVLLDLFRQRIVSDVPDPECRIEVLGVPTIFDPTIANVYDAFAAATLAIDYRGRDQY